MYVSIKPALTQGLQRVHSGFESCMMRRVHRRTLPSSAIPNDVNKTKFLIPRPRPISHDQDQEQNNKTKAKATEVNKGTSNQIKSNLFASTQAHTSRNNKCKTK